MGQLDQMIDAAARAARGPYFRALAAQMEGSDDREAWNSVRRVFGRAYLLALLLGRAEIARATRRVRHEFDEAPGEAELIGKSRFDRFNLGEDGDLFINRDFAKAIRDLAGRVPRLRSEIDAIVAEAQRMAEAIAATEEQEALIRLVERHAGIRRIFEGSFFVTDLEIGPIREVRSLVADWLRAEGQGARGSKSISEFIDEAGLRGASGLTRARLETVMRTNLISAGNEGQAATLRSPRVMAEFPLVEIDEIRDSRTRGNPAGEYPDGGYHWQMDGYVGTLADIERSGLRPPNGYNCRAGLRPLGREEAASRGLLRPDGSVDPAAVRRSNGDRQRIIDSGLYPDPGFKIPAITR